MDYKEKYIKEKLISLKVQAELLVMRHEKLLNEYENVKKELILYNEKKEEKTKKTTQKKTTKKKGKKSGKK